MSKYSIEIKFPHCTLVYDLFENPFVEKWVKIFNQEFLINKVGINNDGDFYGSALFSASDLLANMQRCVDVLNNYRPGSIENKVYKGITHFDLMLLHKDFERLEPNPLFRAPLASQTIVKALTELNIFIHQYECINSPPLSHIDVSPRPVNRYKFTDEDYSYFTPSIQKGYLYLPYGVTGIPPMTAYMGKMTDMPVPQSNITSGISMYFVDITRNVDREHMREWFRTHWNMDIEDPKNSLGYIPLGQMRDFEKMDEIVQNILRDRKILSMELLPRPDMSQFATTVEPLEIQPDEKKKVSSGVLPNASWPSGKELFQQLECNPYLFLPIQFDHLGCFNEAQNLLDQFVEHRKYDQESNTEGKWKSLAINGLGGDSRKTQNHLDYGVNEPTYKLTEIASRCPKTIEFLNQITDISKCERIRFMLLEPGAKIKVHSDAVDKDVTLAVNIALNMPAGCDFWTDLGPQGEKTLFSQKIPINDGSVFLFNNAPYHMVENNSQQNRIHIIIHGPLRFENEKYLGLARLQNNLRNEKNLINRLVFKRQYFGKPLSAEFLSEWISCGVDQEFFPPNVAMAYIEDESVDEETRKEALHLITKASLFPLRLETIQFAQIDSWMKSQYELGCSLAFLIGSGTYSTSHKSFYLGAAEAIGKMVSSNSAMMGQIINRPLKFEFGKRLPYIHEQLMFVDLKKWSELDFESVGTPYEDQCVQFPSYDPSKENFHDDYTPFYLKPGQEVIARSGSSGWGTRFLAKALSQGFQITNVPMMLRNAKKFTYPRAPKDYQYREVKAEISKFLGSSKDRIFVFNNEQMQISGLSGFDPDVLVTVSSGFKPFVLAKQFWGTHRMPSKLVVVDYSERSLLHFKKVSQAKTFKELSQVLKDEYLRQYGVEGKAEKEKTVEERLQRVISDEFDGSFENLKYYLNLFRSATFQQMNFIDQPEDLIKYIDPVAKTLFWHSNAWDCNPVFFKKTEQECKANYKMLAENIAKKVGGQFWLSTNGQSAIIGAENIKPKVYMTDGLQQFNMQREMNVSLPAEKTEQHLEFGFSDFFKAVYFADRNHASLSFKVNEACVNTFYSSLAKINEMFTVLGAAKIYNVRPILVEKKDRYVRFTYYSNDGVEFNFRFSHSQWQKWHEQHRLFPDSNKSIYSLNVN